MPRKCLWYWLKGWTVQGLFKQKLCKSLLSWWFRKINGNKQRKIERRMEEFVKNDNGQGSNRNYNDSLASVNNASSSWFTRVQTQQPGHFKTATNMLFHPEIPHSKEKANNWVVLNTENYNCQQHRKSGSFQSLTSSVSHPVYYLRDF